jgi:hypothetical protein
MTPIPTRDLAAMLAAATKATEAHYRGREDFMDGLLAMLAKHFKCDIKQLKGQRSKSLAKGLFVWFSDCAGIPHSQIGRKLGTDRSICTYYIGRVEDCIATAKIISEYKAQLL